MDNYSEEYLSGLSDDEFEESMRELIELAKKSPSYQENRSFRLTILQMENELEKFSETAAREVSMKLMKEIKIDGLFKETDKEYSNMRKALIQGIKDNPQNEDLKKIAGQMIQIEKDYGQYNPDDWKDLPDL